MQPGRRAYVTLVSLVILAVILFAISGIPRFRDANHGIDAVVGGIGWFGGLLTALVFLVLLVRTLWLARRQRRPERAQRSAA
jgi:hypothetical protein